jgi:hypothetical protein
MGSARTNKSSKLQRSNNDEGIDFVRCRMCGDHRRVIEAFASNQISSARRRLQNQLAQMAHGF